MDDQILKVNQQTMLVDNNEVKVMKINGAKMGKQSKKSQ